MNISIPAGGENPPTKEPPKGKNSRTTRNPHKKRRKGKPRVSKQGDERVHTTEPHRIPTTEVHPTKIASKAKHQEMQKQTKRVT